MATAMAGQIFFFYFLISLFLPSSAQCSNYTFSSNRTFSSCTSLPQLNAHLHWNYIPAVGNVEIAYRAAQSSGRWIAWAINPTGLRMLGSQALVAFQHSNGSMAVYTTPINSYSPSMQPGPLSFDVMNLTAEYMNGQMIIYATILVPNNTTVVNQVWQEGPVLGDIPGIHSTFGANLESLGTLDFLSGQAASAGGGNLGIGSRKLLELMNHRTFFSL